MFENFGLEISKLFKTAELIRYDLRHPYVGSEHLLLAILKSDNEVSKELKKYNINYTNFKKELVKIVGSASVASELNLYTPLLKRIIENSIYDAKEDNNDVVTVRHLFISMLEEGEGIALRILLLMNVDLEQIYNLFKKNRINEIKFEHGILMNDIVSDDEKVVCRDDEINKIIETLLRHKKNNPLLIGKAGVGKTAIVEELVRRIKRKEVPAKLENSQIIMLEMGNLVSGTKYRGEFEEKLTKIIDKATENSNIILFIDEIHSMVNAGAADGAVSAADILKPYLARGNLKVIGATTLNEYNKYFLKDKALSRRFEKIMINEPSIEETKQILLNVKKEYEKYHNIKITAKNIEDIVKYSEMYIHDKCNPDKSIELLDSICAKVNLNEKNTLYLNDNLNRLNKIIENKNKFIKNNEFDKAIECKTIENSIKKELDVENKNVKNTITKEDIFKVIEEKTSIPLTKNKRNLYKDTFNELENNIIGQKEAINKIKNFISSDSNKVKSMLFIGTSGIGKTQTAKILGKNYNLVKLDMSEYCSENSINKLIGAPSGYVGYDDTYIFEIIREKPHSLILIDEIEKANPKVLNLFLNILDEGKVRDSHNEVIDFNNCLIIATGNILAEKTLGFGDRKNNFDKYLSKELISRFNEIVEFKTLTKEDITCYIKKKYNFKPEKIEKIIEKSDYKKYGLRDIENCIREENCKQLI